jgi:hypothetical protein
MSAVAQSTCTAINPHNSKVKNHGMCVSRAARHHGGGNGHGHGNNGHGHADGHAHG